MSKTLRLILENWKGNPTEQKDINLPFDVENFCRQMDPIVEALISCELYLNVDSAFAKTKKEELKTFVSRALENSGVDKNGVLRNV